MRAQIEEVSGNQLLIIGFVLLLAIGSFAQHPNKSSYALSNVVVDQHFLGSELIAEAELMSELDAKRSNIGDQVVLKTTKSSKRDGIVVIEKGARIIGTIIDAKPKTKTDAQSSIVIMIERIENRKVRMNVSAEFIGLREPQPLALGLLSSESEKASPSSNDPHGPTCSCSGGRSEAPAGRRESVSINDGLQTGNLRGLRISQMFDRSDRGAFSFVMPGKNFKIERGTTFSMNISELPTVAIR